MKKSLLICTTVLIVCLFGFSMAETKNEIVIWGDSLTAMGGWTTCLADHMGMNCINAGVGRETVVTIAARQGADVMLVNNIVIPADTTPVVIADRDIDGGITTYLGRIATPLLQDKTDHFNPCWIGDVKGTLIWTGASFDDLTGNWEFTRSEPGAEVVIDRPTALRAYADVEKNSPYLMIIYMGQNGGYSDISDLIYMHKLMIAHANAQHYLILGFSTGTAESRAEYEAAMREAFGRYFISLREYLSHPIYTDNIITSCYGLDDAGLIPTQADLDAIAVGSVPRQLLIDACHYNEAGMQVIGDYLYRQCVDLNIVP